MADKKLEDLVYHALKDLHFAENAILKALPKVIDAAHDSGLKKALTKHMDETKTHVARLEDAFAAINQKSASVPCEAIKGILKEGDEIIGEFGKSPIGDAGIVFACQAVEHYEINRYGTLHAWALELGNDKLADLMSETLKEEYAADDKLTELATEGLNHPDAKASRAQHRRKK